MRVRQLVFVPVLGVEGNFNVWSTAALFLAFCFMLLCNVVFQGCKFNTLKLTIATLKDM